MQGSEDAVRFENVRFEWQPGRAVLDVPAFRIPRGERVFLHGPSGSGKSTLLGLIGGVLEPRAGRIHVAGQELGGLARSRRDRFRADHIGFVFQMFNLIPYLSVLENVVLSGLFSERRRKIAEEQGSGSAKASARRLLAALDVEGEELLTRPAAELSQGQQQRVACARALFGRPEVLIADEPTSSLDAAVKRRFLELLMAECATAATTLLFVSHDVALAAGFDRSVAMEDINGADALSVSGAAA